jgi:hypothetical protein
MLDRRRSAGVLRLVLPVLQQSRYVLDRSTAVLVRPSEVVIVHCVAGVILQPARMLYGAHHTAIHSAAAHGAWRHRRRTGGGMIHNRSRLFCPYLFHRPAHSFHRSHGLMMLDAHRIRRRLAYDGINRSHRLHRSHRLGRAHAVVDRTHRRRIG